MRGFMRALIIGTTGQLATELHRKRDQLGGDVLPPRKVDIADADALCALLDESHATLVINAAAYTAVDRAEQDRERAFAVNSSGPRVLARWCASHGAILVHISTDYVFDGTKTDAYLETDPTGPVNTYGESKLAGEQAIREELERHLIVRTSWVFSAHGQNFVKTMRRLARERDSLRVVADQRGRPTSAADLAEALWRVVREDRLQQRRTWGTFHLSNTGATTWHALAQAVVALEAPLSGRRPTVEAIPSTEFPTPAKRPQNSVLDTTRFESAFGFGLRPFRAALEDVMRELQNDGASETSP